MMTINKTLIALYCEKNDTDIIEYCNSLYKEINIDMFSHKYIKDSSKICTYTILEVLKNKKTESSNVLIIARNFLISVLDQLKLNKNNNFNELNSNIYPDLFNKFNTKAHSEKIKIIFESIEILWFLYKMDIDNMIESIHEIFETEGEINTKVLESTNEIIDSIYNNLKIL